jgi:hypothetical protein
MTVCPQGNDLGGQCHTNQDMASDRWFVLKINRFIGRPDGIASPRMTGYAGRYSQGRNEMIWVYVGFVCLLLVLNLFRGY